MMTGDKNIPKIRFQGFTEPWKKCKLGDISEIIGGGTPSTEVPEYWDGNINWYSPAEIGSQIYVKKSQRTITELGLEKSSAKILPIGSVLFTSRAGIGSMAILEEKASTNQGFQSIVPIKNQLDSYFIFSRSNELKKYAETVGAGSTFIEVSGKQMKEMEILIPKIDEQSQIGLFFKQFDNLITLHQRKYEKLKQIKKSMLEKMFPHKEKNVPEIRFKEFTEPWERRKLGDVATEMVAGGDIDKNLILDEGRYPVIANALTNDGIVGYYNEDYRIKAPAVTVTGRGEVGHAKARNIDFTPVVRLLSLKSNHDVFFLENAINTLKIVIESTGVPQLTAPQLAKYELFFPKSLNEEEKIGSFFRNLDHLITLHQRKYEKLKQIKKSLLEKMFAQ